jgi:hypothetical protein
VNGSVNYYELEGRYLCLLCSQGGSASVHMTCSVADCRHAESVNGALEGGY